MSLQETLDSLQLILSNEQTFQQVVDTVFSNLDGNQDGTLDIKVTGSEALAAIATQA